MNLRDVLESVRADYGQLDPATLLDAATPEDHPLHTRFEWDDTEAGHAYRLIQAHRIIQRVKILDTSNPKKPRTLRRYYPVARAESRQPDYQDIEDIVHDDMATRVLLADMRRDYETLKRRYGHLMQFVEMLLQDVAA
jgi:hypothetical protein